MSKEIKNKITEITEKDMAYALREAWKIDTGKYPPNSTLAILMAQWALETGRGKFLHNYNIGNLKPGSNYEGYYQYYRCSEIINGKEVWFDPPHIQCKFRAYLTLTEGVADYISFLHKDRYRKALRELHNGKVKEYTIELKNAGYFTASLNLYLKAMTSIWNEFMKKLVEFEKDWPQEITHEDKEKVLDLIDKNNKEALDEFYKKKYD